MPNVSPRTQVNLLQVRISKELKDQYFDVCDRMGWTASREIKRFMQKTSLILKVDVLFDHIGVRYFFTCSVV